MALVALDQEPALVIGGEVHRAEQPLAAALADPILGGPEQGFEDLGVVLGLDEAELTVLAALELVPAAVDLGGDPPDGLAVSPGEEVFGIGMLEVGFFSWRGTGGAHRSEAEPTGCPMQPHRQLDELRASRRPCVQAVPTEPGTAEEATRARLLRGMSDSTVKRVALARALDLRWTSSRRSGRTIGSSSSEAASRATYSPISASSSPRPAPVVEMEGRDDHARLNNYLGLTYRHGSSRPPATPSRPTAPGSPARGS